MSKATHDYSQMQHEARHLLRIDYRWEKSCPGTYAVTATIPSWPVPMGVVWFRDVGNTAIETLSSFVDSRVRRCGVRTQIHRWMLASFPSVNRIITTSGTDYGLAWLKATGFKVNPRTKDWEYHRRAGDG
jgi:hypothetical protein